MSEQTAALIDVLRCELTAVHQQFVHVLALRDWGEDETAARIMQVDCVDFPNAMQIIDHLVETAQPIALAPGTFTPGTNPHGILAAEWALEERFSAVLDAAKGSNGRTGALVASAAAPRRAYADWLAERLAGADETEPSTDPAAVQTADAFAHLIAMIEQAMVHAFVHWHRGEAQNADAAWATSGAAMMHATAFVHLFAARGTAPRPGTAPVLRIAEDPNMALEFDRQLAERCANVATLAADGCGESVVAELCREVARSCRALGDWRPGEAHPAAATNPTAFASFEATLAKFVRVA
jgi:hypothetical protein